MSKFDAGGNRGGGTIKSSIGSLWGDQHYGPEYNCGAGTAIYAPFQGGRLGVKKYHSKEILFFLSSVEKVVSWDGFDVTDKKTELTAAVVGSFFFVQPSPSQDESVHGD